MAFFYGLHLPSRPPPTALYHESKASVSVCLSSWATVDGPTVVHLRTHQCLAGESKVLAQKQNTQASAYKRAQHCLLLEAKDVLNRAAHLGVHPQGDLCVHIQQHVQAIKFVQMST